MIKNLEKQIEKLGFKKQEENKYGVSYVRYCNNYKQCVGILHKENGKYIIQSYENKTNSDGFNNCVGLTIEETKLFLKKAKQLKRKYGWEL